MIFKRFITQIGEDKWQKLKQKKVLIIGLGGVGGHAVESLVRSGIHHLILIDYDTIELTNINRQIIAHQDNLNQLKTNAWQQRIKQINPDCHVTLINEHLNKDNFYLLDNYQFDYLIDACDSLFTKQLLIKYASDNKIKIISSMGMGNKLDPSKITITKLSKTINDPLAKKLRKFVKDNQLKDIPVVASNEMPIKNTNEFITSNAFVPAISGILMASYIINDIIKNH